MVTLWLVVQSAKGLMANNRELQRLDREKLELMEAQLSYEDGLPHLYGFKLYKWARDFWESPNRMKIVVAANQISKSSTQLRHMIDLATDKSKWPKFFPKRRPTTFWYVYPNKTTSTQEFENKWVQEFMPRNEFKDHPDYGWKVEYKNKEVYCIRWNSGVILYFKSWGVDLQSGTVDYVAVDEELPQNLYDELNLRVARYDGMFSMVFTATLNQPFWYDAIEKIGRKGERFPQAFKQQVSMFDCMVYEDGTPAVWTEEKINKIINTCGTATEVQRRVYGRFVSEKGLMYPSFSRENNIKPRLPVPPNWLWYSGVDVGSGGKDNHPAAITFVAVRPDYKKARVVEFWKGDTVNKTTAGDVLDQYLKMRGNRHFTGEYYDWASKDFHTLAERSDVPFQMANKDRGMGEALLNTVFKNEILDLDDFKGIEDLALEFTTLRKLTNKSHAKDDGIDSVRYAITKIPFNLESIISSHLIGDNLRKHFNNNKDETEVRRESFQHDPMQSEDNWSYEAEIDEWNDLIGG